MNATRVLAATFGVLIWLEAFGPNAHAAEIDGAWVTPEDACTKVLAKRGNRIAFTKDADLYGSGFIIDANRITGKIAKCTIKSRKQDGAVVHLMTSCSTDIALQDVQFAVKLDGENRLIRLFPGLPELDRTYHRCSFR
jgi:hypothetical protein